MNLYRCQRTWDVYIVWAKDKKEVINILIKETKEQFTENDIEKILLPKKSKLLMSFSP